MSWLPIRTWTEFEVGKRYLLWSDSVRVSAPFSDGDMCLCRYESAADVQGWDYYAEVMEPK